ncbi:MAG: hypothetical protein GDA53_04655 [Rhodobacteraceae bacterium]|nr:hypothetical protein [Paracoccaceae bacterium]
MTDTCDINLYNTSEYFRSSTLETKMATAKAFLHDRNEPVSIMPRIAGGDVEGFARIGR